MQPAPPTWSGMLPPPQPQPATPAISAWLTPSPRSLCSHLGAWRPGWTYSVSECGKSEREIHILFMNYIYVESEKTGRDDLNYKAEIETQHRRGEEAYGHQEGRGWGAEGRGHTVEAARQQAPNENLPPAGSSAQRSRRPRGVQEGLSAQTAASPCCAAETDSTVSSYTPRKTVLKRKEKYLAPTNCKSKKKKK